MIKNLKLFAACVEQGALANDMIALLKKNHSDEEIERFNQMLQGE